MPTIEPRFSLEDEGETIGEFSLAEMIEANGDCPDLVEWFNEAAVGDQFQEIGGTVTRIA